jgi:hypothetical protein
MNRRKAELTRKLFMHLFQMRSFSRAEDIEDDDDNDNSDQSD